MCMSCHKQVQLEEVRGSHVREFPHMQSSKYTKYTKSTLPSSRKIALAQRRRHAEFFGKSMLHVCCRAVCRCEPRHCVRADITRLSRSCVRLVAALGIWASCPSSAVQLLY